MGLTSRLQTRASHQEPIDIGLLAQIPAVLLAHAPTIDNPRLLGYLLADLLLQPLANRGMDLLRLLGAGNLAGANGPDGLVGHDDLAPVGDLVLDGLELAGDNVDGEARLALLERLAAAEDDADAAVERSLGLVGDEDVVLLQDHAALAVAQ